ncbi:DUF2069 domain-containing protein [Aliidiomarina iranensis]|uniref:DUF2069 domain-containing protein n=1 Tax=Aliidiomarina iranensis TaxID=1434071 RepID=A0A432VZQ6_9GAMM|nr:DUF2069 domain-containing protein [Aliidiomarina iranensis]RUO22213.1 DUF2069 domain-containing protein [Aliidiomarina iranensis]
MNTDFLKTASFHRKLTLICYPGLLIFVILWHGFLAPNEFLSVWLTMAIWVVPLLFPLKGILQGNAYTHAWANFILIFYFMHSLTALYTNPGERWYAAIELLLTTGAFIGATYYARYRGRELGLGIKKKKGEKVVTNAGKMD